MTLLNGFWFVRDRCKQVRLDKEILECVEATIVKTNSAFQRTLESQRHGQVDLDALPPIAEADHMAVAIAVLDNKPEEGQLCAQDHEALRRCARAQPVVKECLRSLSGWAVNEVAANEETWKRCADALRAVRSSSALRKLQLRTQEFLPKALEPVATQDFFEWLGEMAAENEDISAILSQCCDDPSTIQSQNAGQALAFCGKMLSVLSSAPGLED